MAKRTKFWEYELEHGYWVHTGAQNMMVWDDGYPDDSAAIAAWEDDGGASHGA